MSKKVFPLFLITLIFICQGVFCQAANNSAQIANRRTAMRYLKLAKQNLSDKDFDAANSNATIGLAYDDSIADLWYISAQAKAGRGDKKSEILPLVEKSLSEGSSENKKLEWVDYNKDGARVLYAGILCSTRKFSEAVSVLDEAPFIYSADAEYIRAKSYYNERTAQSIESARLKIDAARRVYPKDARFAELFYSFEYGLLNENNSIDELAQKVADGFLASLSKYRKSNPEIELLASVFVQDSDRKSRLIQAFNARGEKSALYPALALDAGLIDERAALDYFYDFADKEISLSVLQKFIKSIQNEENKKELGEYLTSYAGTLLIDTDGDLATNMTVKYERGRPSKIAYDENQDDEDEWTSECDFGVPLNLTLESPKLEITYGNWPFIEQVVYEFDSKDGSGAKKVTFDLIADSLEWCPFNVENEETAAVSLGTDFFVPALIPSENIDFSGSEIVNSALGYTMPSSERANAEISVKLLNGFAQQAEYSVDGKVYAKAKFENGLPSSRLVDMDGDGVFEIVEEYGYSTDESQKFISENDEMQVITNLFGRPASKTGIYVKSIKIDKNGDTVPDFAEEYTAGEGKISSWDTNNDGKWDVRYVKLPSQDGKNREEAMFFEPVKNRVVTVESENGVPVSVKADDENLSVINGADKNFYWLSESGSYATENKIIERINQIDSQGVCIIVEDEKSRFLAVRIESKIYAEKLPAAFDDSTSQTVNNDEKK